MRMFQSFKSWLLGKDAVESSPTVPIRFPTADEIVISTERHHIKPEYAGIDPCRYNGIDWVLLTERKKLKNITHSQDKNIEKIGHVDRRERTGFRIGPIGTTVKAFLRQQCEYKEGCTTSLDDIYSRYLSWAMKTGVLVCDLATRKGFGRFLAPDKISVVFIKSRNTHTDKHARKHLYVGIALKTIQNID